MKKTVSQYTDVLVSCMTQEGLGKRNNRLHFGSDSDSDLDTASIFPPSKKHIALRISQDHSLYEV